MSALLIHPVTWDQIGIAVSLVCLAFSLMAVAITWDWEDA